jgi:regulatory protein
MVITSIEQQQRNRERVSVFLDGEFAFGLHREILIKFGLRKGDRITHLQVEEITKAEELSLAKQRGLHLLSYRMRTEKELRTRLIEKEFPPTVVDDVIKEFTKLGLINDAEFARVFLRDRRTRRPSGVRRLKQELRLKGVRKETIEDVLHETTESQDDQNAAFDAASKHMKRTRISTNRLEREKQTQRLASFLARRGFNWSSISPVLKKYFHGEQPPLEEP